MLNRPSPPVLVSIPPAATGFTNSSFVGHPVGPVDRYYEDVIIPSLPKS